MRVIDELTWPIWLSTEPTDASLADAAQQISRHGRAASSVASPSGLSVNDFEVLSTGISWCNWSPSCNEQVADVYENFDVDWVPMTWNGNNPDRRRSSMNIPTSNIYWDLTSLIFESGNLTPE